MKKNFFTAAIALTIAGSLMMTSCIGSFRLTHKVLEWNDQIGGKFVNELVFIAFWILPVYELSAMADILVINSIEFWSGNNPIAYDTKIIDGKDARYEIMSNPEGYIVTNLNDGSVIKFNFDEVDNSWSVEANGEEHKFMRYIDDNNVEMVTPDGTFEQVELSNAGLYAYRQAVQAAMYASR